MSPYIPYYLTGILPFSLMGKSRPITLNLFHVVYNAEQVPLDIHLSFAAYSKSIQAESGPDVGKWRLTNRKTYGVKRPACG
jgi:hypothetical protein